MDGNLATTYTLIHAFLTKQAHPKAAAALKKAAKDVVILKDALDIDGPQLDDIIREWKLLKAAASSVDSSSSSSSSSDSDSDSDSSSSSSSSSSSASSSKLKKKTKKKSSASSSSSSSDSDSESEATPKIAAVPVAAVKSKAKVAPSASSSSSSSDDSDDESSDSDASSPPKHAAERDSSRTLSTPASSDAGGPSEEKGVSNKAVKQVAAAATSDDSNSDSDSDSDSDSSSSESDAKPPVASKTASKKSKAPAPAPETPGDDVQVTKKRRTSEGGASVPTAVVVNAAEANPVDKPGKPGKPGKKVNAPFRRVNPDTVETTSMMDNRYQVKAAPTNDYGQRAHNDLIVTRGAGFRKEKNKKKRGSYRGGEITMESHSFKFD